MSDLQQTMTARLYENLATAVLLFDQDLHLLSINGAGEDLLLISNKRVLGRTPKQIWPMASFFSETIARSLFSGNTCIERGVDLELNHHQTIKVDCMITPILIGDFAEQIIVELLDANVFVQVNQEIYQQTVQEAAKESLQGMAHEIKNPLGGIRGAAQLLAKELTEPALLEYTQIIINESDRLKSLIERMLTTTIQPVKVAINIHEVLEYVIAIVLAESTHSFDKQYDPSIPAFKGDRAQIIQAILNLLRNAVQAIDDIDGDGLVTVKTRIQRQMTIQHRRHRQVIAIEIIDTGVGIPAEIEHWAFYPMVTRRAEGTGLGLSIAQQLIQAHGGFIKYKRAHNKTVFTILLPIT